MKAPKYDNGNMVYSYQNKTVAAPVCKREFRPYIDNSHSHDLDSWAYKLTFQDPRGGSYSSKWIDEDSLSFSPLALQNIR